MSNTLLSDPQGVEIVYYTFIPPVVRATPSDNGGYDKSDLSEVLIPLSSTRNTIRKAA